jgi:hypothetical protein
MEVPVKPRRPPSLPLICEEFPDHSSFSVFRETLMAPAIDFKKLTCYEKSSHYAGKTWTGYTNGL